MEVVCVRTEPFILGRDFLLFFKIRRKVLFYHKGRIGNKSRYAVGCRIINLATDDVMSGLFKTKGKKRRSKTIF